MGEVEGGVGQPPRTVPIDALSMTTLSARLLQATGLSNPAVDKNGNPLPRYLQPTVSRQMYEYRNQEQDLVKHAFGSGSYTSLRSRIPTNLRESFGNSTQYTSRSNRGDNISPPMQNSLKALDKSRRWSMSQSKSKSKFRTTRLAYTEPESLSRPSSANAKSAMMTPGRFNVAPKKGFGDFPYLPSEFDRATQLDRKQKAKSKAKRTCTHDFTYKAPPAAPLSSAGGCTTFSVFAYEIDPYERQEMFNKLDAARKIASLPETPFVPSGPTPASSAVDPALQEQLAEAWAKCVGDDWNSAVWGGASFDEDGNFVVLLHPKMHPDGVAGLTAYMKTLPQWQADARTWNIRPDVAQFGHAIDSLTVAYSYITPLSSGAPLAIAAASVTVPESSRKISPNVTISAPASPSSRLPWAPSSPAGNYILDALSTVRAIRTSK